MDKIKVKLVMSEWYPVYEEYAEYACKEYTMSADLWQRYKQALKAFSSVREELNNALYDQK